MARNTLIWSIAFFICVARASAESPSPTVDQVKQAFAKAIVSSGYKIGDTTNAVIEREAPRIAATIEDMKNVRIFADKVKGVEHGFSYALFPNNQIQRMGYLNNGKRIGPWRFYFSDGTLSTKLQYDDDGNEIGQHVAYLRNGNVHYLETYAKGVRHGPKTTFYDDGTTHMHQMWHNGQMDGLSLIYHANGTVKKFASWSKGRQHGTVVLYDEAGKITEQAQYVDGQKQ